MHLLQFQNTLKNRLLSPVKEASTQHTGVDLYASGHWASLSRSLHHKYHVTGLYMAERFSEYVHRYIQDHPLKDPYLGHYGNGLSVYLPCPVARSLAQLEWLMHRALVGWTKASSLQLEDVFVPGSMFFGLTSFRLKNNVSLLKSPHNLKAIWMALKNNKAAPILNEDSFFLIGSEGQNSFFVGIKEEDYYALLSLKMGAHSLQKNDKVSDHYLHKNLHRFLDFLTKD